MRFNAVLLITTFIVFFLFNTGKISAGENNKTNDDQMEKLYKAAKLSAPVGEVIGITTYDLQTNNSACRRIDAHPSNNWFYAGWTMGRDFTPAAPARGTGFNYYDSRTGTWLPRPINRIEPFTRTGWPTMGFSMGRQFSIGHTFGQGMIFTWRPGTTNLNDWNEVYVGELVNDPSGVWARAVADEGNIYCIISRQGNTMPVGGIRGGLNFIRSLDNGNTWESTGSLEENYTNSIPGFMSNDSYSIDASNGVISVVFGGEITEVILYKSIDQGENFTKTVVQKSSNPLIENLDPDANYGYGDFTIDPYFSSTGNTVIIDSEGKTHVVFSAKMVYKPSIIEYSNYFFNYFDQLATALFYWNEDMQSPQIIGKTIMNDADNDGILGSNLNMFHTTFRPSFYAGLICHPQLGIDDDDNLYVSYTANVDGDDVPDEVTYLSLEEGGGEVLPYTQDFSEIPITFTDVFMIKSTNSGDTWQGPLNVTKASSTEETFPSIPRNIGDTIMLMYMHDPLPGTLLQGPQEMATINQIAVTKILPGDINDNVAPPDSEPYFTSFNLFLNFFGLSVPQGCSLSNSEVLQTLGRGMDYPDGIIEEYKIAGLADYSTPGFYTEGIFVEDSQGNISDTVYYNFEVLPDTESPIIEFEICNQFTIVAGQPYTLPTPIITDYLSIDGVTRESDCDVSENLEITHDIDSEQVGTYTATYTVSDFAGNSANATLIINVIESDGTVPALISGAVIAATGCNVSGIEVIIDSERNEIIEIATTDDNGNYNTSYNYGCGYYEVRLNESTLPNCYNGNLDPVGVQLNNDGQLARINFGEVEACTSSPAVGTFNCNE